jgi:hypothetical protein
VLSFQRGIGQSDEDETHPLTLRPPAFATEVQCRYTHGGTTPDVRNVPLYLSPPDGTVKGDTQTAISQLQAAPTICKLLGDPEALGPPQGLMIRVVSVPSFA